jgi:hypothetical protein
MIDNNQNSDKAPSFFCPPLSLGVNTKILLASIVRQDDEIFKLFYDSLNNLEIPQNVKLERLFVLHNSPNLAKYIDKKDYVQAVETNGEYKKDENTHYWQNHNLTFISNMKNEILRYAYSLDFDYVWFIDSDLILQPDTLYYLLKADKDIVSEIFWTKWTPDSEEMPNAWDYDNYSFLPDTIENYKKKGVYECGGTGACILISRNVMAKGVNYSFINNISFWGEDRAFSIRAVVNGFKLYVDTNCPALHLYRQSDVERYKNRS